MRNFQLFSDERDHIGRFSICMSLPLRLKLLLGSYVSRSRDVFKFAMKIEKTRS